MFTLAIFIAGIAFLVMSGYGVIAILVALAMLPWLGSRLARYVGKAGKLITRIDEKIDEKIFKEEEEKKED